ncbi:hypothetical protein V1522DRAFT_393226 [Lipomyces starkeyi]
MSVTQKNLHSELQGVRTSLLAGSKDNEVVLLHLYSTELEAALSSTFLHSNQLTSQQRLNAGLETIKSWLDVFFTITPAAYIGFPLHILAASPLHDDALQAHNSRRFNLGLESYLEDRESIPHLGSYHQQPGTSGDPCWIG